MNSPTSKDLTAEINYFKQRLGTLEFEFFETKNAEKGKQIKEITEKLSILKEKQKKFSDISKKRDVFEEAMMKKMFGDYLTKKTKNKKALQNDEETRMKKSFSPNKGFRTIEEKLQHCACAKEYEIIKEDFLQIFQRKFYFEDEIETWGSEENDIL